MRTLREIAALAKRDFLRVERTRDRWANPLSVFTPDPLHLACVAFNAGQDERTRELKGKLTDLRQKVEAIACESH